MQPIRIFVGAIDSRPTSGQPLMMSGPFGMTGLLAFRIPVRYRRPLSLMPCIIFVLLDGLVVDPMAGGGTTLDVCQSMGRRCLAYDLEPSRPDIHHHDIRAGFPAAAVGCDLIFCDPPYHTMLAQKLRR